MDANDKGSTAPHGSEPSARDVPAKPSLPPGPAEPGVPDVPTDPNAPASPTAPASLPVPTARTDPSGFAASRPAPPPGPRTTGLVAPHTAPRTGLGAPNPAPGPAGHPGPQTGLAALSLRYQVGAAVALAVVAVTVCVHIGMVFLHVAPSNTLTKQHGKAIDDWIYPEFEQNWKLFAPNPLQQNIAVQVRAQIRSADGGIRTTGWYDLSAQDGRAVDGNLLPSHTQQNELRRAWDFFVVTHDTDNRPMGLRGALSESYLRRIVSLRLDRENAAGKGGTVDLVQIRSRTTNVPPPEWSKEQVTDKPVYRVLPWWSVGADGGGDK
ncbi:DUF5819 family protein [Streptomyces cellulosae]|uniref:DUF5819 family protein n=1 Tax=Streptomyces cellulosae TaxID=1968 RepID=A0ABW7Y476_STRCE